MTASAAHPAVVVLAGGASTRFGSDKLAADAGGTTLLNRLLLDLPEEADLIVVGPNRAVDRTARFVCEDPPGGGPAAGLIVGLRAVHPTQTVLVVPGDAPGSASGARQLANALGELDAAALMATDPDGRDQPLQLALRPVAVRRLIELAGPNAGAGASARRLVLGLGSALQRLPLHAEATIDVDTREQLAAYLRGGSRGN